MRHGVLPHGEPSMKQWLAALAVGTLMTMPALAQTVKISTSMGDITVALDKAKAPKSVENFIKYINSGHYTGTVFHRVISDFMIQGGGMDGDLVEKSTKEPIELESANGLSNVRGTLAMARTGVPNSATSQFFINVKGHKDIFSKNRKTYPAISINSTITTLEYRVVLLPLVVSVA